MRHLDLFSGIGGFAYAAKMVWGEDYECIGFCDNDKYCQQLLKRRFPNVKIWDDIRAVTADTESDRNSRNNGNNTETQEKIRGGIIKHRSSNQPQTDIITGGFPCQPFSCAGKRKGTADDRFLWDEMYRVICEFVPRWVIAENVRGLLSIEEGMVFNKVLTDLENAGYEVQPFIIPACAVNAPHRRDRVWIIANKQCERPYGLGQEESIAREQQIYENQKQGWNEMAGDNGGCNRRGDVANPESGKSEQQTEQEGREDIGRGSWEANWLEVATELCGVSYGLSAELDGFKLSKSGHRVERLKALGNSIVPQVAMEIMKAIKKQDEQG